MVHFIPRCALYFGYDNIYFLDCGIPSQPGVIIDHSGSTLKDSNASVTACDTDAGYVGTPDVSTIYCNSDGQWDLATGCTGKMDFRYLCFKIQLPFP